MSCYIRKFPGEIRSQGWQGGLIGEGVAHDKGGLLVGGQGVPIWLACVIEKGCEEFDV